MLFTGVKGQIANAPFSVTGCGSVTTSISVKLQLLVACQGWDMITGCDSFWVPQSHALAQVSIWLWQLKSQHILVSCVPRNRSWSTRCLHTGLWHQACSTVEGCASVCSVVSNSLWSHGLYLARLLLPWNSPGKNTEVGCHFLHQGIFVTQRSNSHLDLCLLHWQADSLAPSRLGSQSGGMPRDKSQQVYYALLWANQPLFQQSMLSSCFRF